MVFTPSERQTLLTLNLVASSLSFIGSCFIVVCFIILKDLRKLLPFQLVFYLSFSDILYSIGNFIGDPADGSSPCIAQSLILSFFELSSLCWSVTIAFTLHMVVLLQKPVGNDKLKYFHLLIWGYCLIMTILPLFTSSYGDAGGWCWIKDAKDADIAWRFIQFYVPLWIAICYNIYVFGSAYRKMSSDNKQKKLKDRLGLYPLVLIICWIFGSINRLYQIKGAPILWLSGCHIFFASLNGLLNAAVYGLSDEVRKRLRSRFGFQQMEADDLAEDGSTTKPNPASGIVEPSQAEMKKPEVHEGGEIEESEE